jgi:hypothetical protein
MDCRVQTHKIHKSFITENLFFTPVNLDFRRYVLGSTAELKCTVASVVSLSVIVLMEDRRLTTVVDGIQETVSGDLNQHQRYGVWQGRLDLVHQHGLHMALLP